MKDSFFEDKDITCIVLCAGEGTRLFPLTLNQQKAMLEVKGKPILYYGIDFWRRYANKFVFIVSYKKENVCDYLKSLSLDYKVLEQKGRKGIANAISLAEGQVTDNFIVILADCMCKGKFVFPKGFKQGFGVWKTNNKEDIKRSFSVEIDGDHVSKVIEKPSVLKNDLCGMGYYFFNKKLFDYIPKTKPSPRTGMIEITDVIQCMIDHGEKISPVFFEGDYLNVTFEEDLKKAEKVVL